MRATTLMLAATAPAIDAFINPTTGLHTPRQAAAASRSGGSMILDFDKVMRSMRGEPEKLFSPVLSKDFSNAATGAAGALKPVLSFTPKTELLPKEVMLSLALGNKRYVENLKEARKTGATALVPDAYAQTPVQAISVSCARSFAPVESIFDAEPGSIHSLRVCGNVCQADDGVVGSCEFALSQYEPAAIVVLGNENNDMVETAVARAMIKAGRKDAPKMDHLKALEGEGEEDVNGLLKALEGPAEDALGQLPQGSFADLCVLASKLNVWSSIEVLLTTSRIVAERVTSGELEVHGAYYEASSGRVQMLGQHPSVSELITELPSDDYIRSAAKPSVPAEEAFASLYAGNKRYTDGKGGTLSSYDTALLSGITEEGQNPVAIILGCADARAPAELFFDARPGDLFVLRNAGNTLLAGSGSTLGSAEFAVGPLDTKLIVVTGHTKCGAVTATVQTVAAGAKTSSVGGSIGTVLDDIVDAAKSTLDEMPDAELADQVKYATKLNVFNAMKKLIENSESITNAVIRGEVIIQGSVYDIKTGVVEWLGEHPELAKITKQKSLPVHEFKTSEYKSRAMAPSSLTGRSDKARAALKKLFEGNKRFTSGKPTAATSSETPGADPYGILVGMAEVRVPLEQVFDANPGELVVQRVEGGIAGTPSSTLFSSIEYAVTRWSPKVLMVVADSESEIVGSAIDQVSGGLVPTAPMRGVLDRVMVAAMRAQRQVDSGKEMTAAGREMKIRQLTTELNAFYTIEQLLRSKAIRQAVRDGLELHAAVLDESSGAVVPLGEHPVLDGLLDEKRY